MKFINWERKGNFKDRLWLSFGKHNVYKQCNTGLPFKQQNDGTETKLFIYFHVEWNDVAFSSYITVV